MTSRLLGRRGDGSAAVRGWVGLYTLGLPRPMRARRQAEVEGDLADETLDAIRHGDQGILFRQRLVRLMLGIPADLSWRFVDAPAAARQLYGPAPWVPLTRWTLGLTGVVAMLAGGGLAIVTLPALTGQVGPDLWPGWGPIGFAIGSAVVLVGVLGSVFWPRLGAMVIVPGALVGLFAAPWLWGSWLLAVIAGAARAYQADEAAP
jgi:hypothetical protein